MSNQRGREGHEKKKNGGNFKPQGNKRTAAAKPVRKMKQPKARPAKPDAAVGRMTGWDRGQVP